MHLGKDLQNNFQQVCVSLCDTPLGKTLKTIHDQDCELFYSHYLHDFELSIIPYHGSGNSQVYNNQLKWKYHNDTIFYRRLSLFLVIQFVLWMWT